MQIRLVLLAAFLIPFWPPAAMTATPPPPQAVNAGFTTPLVDQDFGPGVLDLGCAGQPQRHLWNQGLWWEYPPASCGQISIVYDPVGGQKVLDLQWLPSQSNAYDATTITTIAYDLSQYYGFTHAYYEATFRVTPWKIGGLWPEFWLWGANAVIYGNLPPWGTAPADEIDIVEPHGEVPNWVSSAIRDWGTGSGSYIYQAPVAGLDYTQYHKFGLLWIGNGQWQAGTVCFFLDDFEKGCAATDAAAEYQRHFLMLSMGVGCQFRNGNRSCLNVPVLGASGNGSGAIRLTVGSTAGFNTGFTATITGVGGVSGANGTFIVTLVDGTHMDLQGSIFSGTYTSGGTVNPLSRADMLVKSVRVWGCAADNIAGC